MNALQRFQLRNKSPEEKNIYIEKKINDLESDLKDMEWNQRALDVKILHKKAEIKDWERELKEVK